jgi:hypothetical protein
MRSLATYPATLRQLAGPRRSCLSARAQCKKRLACLMAFRALRRASLACLESGRKCVKTTRARHMSFLACDKATPPCLMSFLACHNATPEGLLSFLACDNDASSLFLLAARQCRMPQAVSAPVTSDRGKQCVQPGTAIGRSTARRAGRGWT